MSHPQLMLSALCRGLRADKETDRKKAMKDLSEVERACVLDSDIYSFISYSLYI